MRITILRHSITRGNLERQYVGSTDQPLAPEGEALALRARRRTFGGRVYTSNLRRTKRTAELVFPGAEILPRSGLAEMNFGDFEGKVRSELENDPDYIRWLDSRCELPCPGGESKAEFSARCREAFLAVCREEESRGSDEVRMVVHNGTIRAVMSAFALPERSYFDWGTDNCCGYLLESASPADGRPFRLVEALTVPDAAVDACT